MKEILQNAFKIKANGQFLISTHRHDCQTAEVGDKFYLIDGGADYRRVGGHIVSEPELIEDLFITSGMPLKEMAQKLLWGTRGINGDRPLEYKLMKDLEKSHLEAILKNCKPLHECRIKVIGYLIKQKQK